MANHRQAEKRHRQSEKRHLRNKDIRSTVRNAVRSVRAAVAAGEDNLPEKFASAERLIRKGTSKGSLHARTASRTISRLHKLIQRSSAS